MRMLIAFDLDGVLYSSEPFLGEVYREAIGNVNARSPGALPRVPATREILDHVGWPVGIILQRLFPRAAERALDALYAETLDVICAHVRRGEGVVFPGVPETLAALRNAGYGLAVASNGRRRYIEAVLATHQLAGFFLPLVTIDEDGGIQRKADVLRIYLRIHRLSHREVVMVGDRASDVEAAAAVGCRFIGCDYGHGYRNEIEGAGPVVSRFAELPDLVEEAAATLFKDAGPG